MTSGILAKPVQLAFRSTQELPTLCTNLAKLLQRQPLFTGTGQVARPCQVIALDKRTDALIYGIFNENAQKMVDKPRNIQDFGSGTNQFFDSHGERIPQGLVYYPKAKPCSIDELDQSYHRILKKMKEGWREVANYPQLAIRRDFNDSTLLVKEQSQLLDEASLINHINRRLGWMHKDLECLNMWYTDEGIQHLAKLYLWLNNSRRGEFEEKFGFEIQ